MEENKMESQLEEEKKLFLDAVKHLDFGSYVFSKNSAEIVDGTPIEYYCERVAETTSRKAARKINIRWSLDTKAAMLILLRHLWVPCTGRTCSGTGTGTGIECLLEKDIADPLGRRNPLLYALFTRLHLLGHESEVFEFLVFPKAADLARYLASLAMRHGLVGVESGWTVRFDLGRDVDAMMRGARAWLTNVTREEQNRRSREEQNLRSREDELRRSREDQIRRSRLEDQIRRSRKDQNRRSRETQGLGSG